MKLVIDIPWAIYEELKSHYKNTTGGLITHEAIANGTPLPKECSDLIDRQTAVNAIKELCEHYTPEKVVMHPHIDFVIDELMKLPAVFKNEKLED